MVMNEVVPFHGNAVALATDGRLDVRALMNHCLSPFEATVPFEDLIETVRKNSTPARRSKNQRQSAAIAIRKAVAGHTSAIRSAMHDLSIASLAPDEPDVRQLIGVMFRAFHAQPTQTSEFFIDTLVMELMEPDVGRPYSLPAIAAAARELWQTLPAPPAIAEFLPCVRKHQQRIEAVFKQLGDVLEASQWADDLIEPDKPVVWDEDDPDFIPF
jgi:hypothetical protein